MSLINFRGAGLLESLRTARWPWLVIAALSVALVILAHSVFQNWLYMPPCEQCVYIRFGFLCITLGALIAAVRPQSLAFKLPGAALSIYGCIYGLMCSFKLASIHHAIHSDSLDAMFGMQGCSLEPHYPLDIPLAQWFPDWFQPTGDCGYDLAVVPNGVELSSLQSALIELYNSSDSWYLIPQWKFMSMADCCILAFGVALMLVLGLLALELRRKAA